MSGRHEGPPIGSAAREATAPPYHGRHRAPAVCSKCGFPAIETADGWAHAEAADAVFCGLVFERAERLADERWSDPEDHGGGPDDV